MIRGSKGLRAYLEISTGFARGMTRSDRTILGTPRKSGLESFSTPTRTSRNRGTMGRPLEEARIILRTKG